MGFIEIILSPNFWIPILTLIIGFFAGFLFVYKAGIKPLRRKKEDLEDQLLYSAKMASIGVMTSGLAHELNGPLTAIIGQMHFLKKHLPSHGHKDAMDKISSSIDRMKKVLKRLRSIGNYSSGDEKNFGVNQAVINSLFFLENRFKEENIEIKIKLPEEILLIYGDINRFEEMIQQILLNSFDTFKKRQKRMGAIGITVTKNGGGNGKIKMVIEDNAGGIEPEVLNNIFKPVIKSGEDDDGPKMGTGLSMVHDSVVRHRGSVSVDSRNGNTIFKFVFPISGIDHRSVEDLNKESTTKEKNLDEVTPGKVRFVVVDDEKDIGEVISMYLEEMGSVVCYQDPVIAIEALKNNPCDVLISDLKMPNMTGIQLAGTVKSVKPNCKTILITGHDQNIEEIKSKYAYIDEVLFKPFNSKELFSAIQKVLKLRTDQKKAA